MSKLGIWISIITLVVTVAGIMPAYYVFLDKPNLVYETQIVNIPLPKDLPGQLPDTLVIVTVQNIGRRPSVEVRGTVRVGGDLVECQVQGPNAAYGQVAQSSQGNLISFSSDRLAPGPYPIKISAWFRGASADPDVGISDARGAATRVTSIAAENGKYKQVGTGVLGLLVGLLGSLIASFATYRAFLLKRGISEAAQRINEQNHRLHAATEDLVKVGELAGMAGGLRDPNQIRR